MLWQAVERAAETTSLGLRYHEVEKKELEREIFKVKTEFGIMSAKKGIFKGRTVTISPEFEECRKIALKRNIPIKEVFRKFYEKVKKINK